MNIVKRFRGELGLVLTAMIWGGGFVACDILVEIMSPLSVLFYRFLAASIIMSLFFWKRLKLVNKKSLKTGIFLGIILYGAFVLQIVGLSYTTPSKNAFITATNVVFVPLIAFVIAKRKTDRLSLLGAVIALVGTAVLSLSSDLSVNPGDLLSLGCSVLFGAHIFFIGETREDPLVMTLLQMYTCCILSFFGVLVTGDLLSPVPIESLWPLIYLAVISTGLSFFLQTASQRFTTETRAAIILCSEGVWGALFSVALGIEPFTLRIGLGAVLILGAAVLSQLGSSKPKAVNDTM